MNDYTCKFCGALVSVGLVCDNCGTRKESHSAESKPNSSTDFRSKTCGECAWLKPHANMCRRVMWGSIQQIETSSGWSDPGYFGDVALTDPACPAHVAKEQADANT